MTRNLFILNFLDLKNRDKCVVMFHVYVTSRTERIFMLLSNLSIRTERSWERRRLLILLIEHKYFIIPARRTLSGTAC